MTASVRILTTCTMDSTPCILLIAPDGTRILINCGEGCQRSFLEYRERLSSVRAICLTHLSSNTIGGLPGMILTSADVISNNNATTANAAANATAMAAAATVQPAKRAIRGGNGNKMSSASVAAGAASVLEEQQQQPSVQKRNRKDPPPFQNTAATAASPQATRRKQRSAWPFLEVSSSSSSSAVNNNNRNGNDKDGDDQNEESNSNFNDNQQQHQQQLQDLTVLGPMGIKNFIHALRHFVRREQFHIHVHEDVVCDLEIIGRNQQQYQQQQTTSATTTMNKNASTKKQKQKKSKSSSHQASSSMNFFITSIVFDENQTTTTAAAAAAAADLVNVDPPKSSNGQKRPRIEMETDNTTNISTTTTTTTASQTSSIIVSYLFTTRCIPGKMQIEKAIALGIPKGPLLAQLKAGKTISFINPKTGKTEVVHSHQVVSPPSPGIGVLILRYPSLSLSSRTTGTNDEKDDKHSQLLDKFFQNHLNNLPDLLRSKEQEENNAQLELIIHLCTRSDFESSAAVAWRKGLQQTLNDSNSVGGNNDNVGIISLQHILVDTHPQVDLNGSPHLGAAVMAQTRSMLSSDIFLTLSSSSSSSSSTTRDEMSNEEEVPVVAMESVEKCNGAKGEANNCDMMLNGNKDNSSSSRSSSDNDNAVLARPTLEYILLPRSKRGLVQEPVMLIGNEQQEIEKARELVIESGAKALADSVLSECGANNMLTRCSSLSPSLENNGNSNNSTSMIGQLIFTGTASAIPCKYRNVTGMCLTDKFGRNMLLDIGEGTIGQLLRVHHHHHDSSKQQQSLLSSITAVWISHPHADHHLGILRLLEERQQEQQSRTITNGKSSVDPVIIIAPPPIFDFLREYSLIVPSIANSYHAIDCRDFLRHRLQNNIEALAKLQSAFHITGCRSVQVQHCPFSYAVILEGTSFGTLVYSGDCRPSHHLAKQAFGADVLIHEATFEDGMEAEAALKRHCTVGEALGVAQEMQAKCLVLTHFSQRYPKIPPTPAMQETLSPSIPIIFAFDFMRLTPQNLLAASKLTPALRLLYPVVSDDDVDDDDMEAAVETGPSEAAQALSVPGLFAQSNLL